MNLTRCLKLWVFILLSTSSVCVSAVILSSETLNEEPTASASQENVLQKPNIASESDIISEHTTESPTKTDKENKKYLKDLTKSVKSRDDSETERHVVKSETETQLPQPNTLDTQSTGERKEEQLPKDTNSEQNVVPSVVVPTPVTEDAVSKDILVETRPGGNIDNNVFGGDIANDSAVLPEQSIAPTNAPKTEDDIVNRNDSTTSEVVQETINQTDSAINATVGKDVLNLTADENQIPVFSEWAQKRLEEHEKEVEQEVVNTSSMKKNTPTASKPPVLKLKNLKNYASPDCGAKIVAANSESSGTGYVLTNGRDEYLLSPCKSRIWFVVELCEAIQAERIDLANFELFSSSPKNFSVSTSGRFPTRDWSNVGKFIAKDERYIQSFDLYPHLFGKYVRVDIHSHYNSEHFCPISLFRVYGTSEFEAFETENRQHPIDDMDDDDDDDQESDTNKGKSNIFKSASDAVMSIVDTVKKSFVKPNENKTIDNESQTVLNSMPSSSNCVSPNHVISCENCSNDVASEVAALIECKQELLKRLLSINVIKNSLYKSHICKTLIGTDININCSEPTDVNSTTFKLTDLQMDYITHLFSIKYLTAMCNLLAAGDRKITWNSTISINSEPPINVTIDKKTSDQILPNDQITQKPTAHIVQTDQIDTKNNPQQNNLENNKPMEHQVKMPSENYPEAGQEIEKNSMINRQVEGESVNLTPATPNMENIEVVPDKSGQNIFNIIESIETNTDNSAQPHSDAEEAQTKESSSVNVEQETPPPVIILPEPTTTPTPNSDLNDGSEEQASNGWTNTPQFGQKLHSESVFLRLSNRVKALERNMSLSAQYLEELSRGYKKQVEELQMSFAKTLVNIEEQSRRNLERKQELHDQNQKLRNDLEILTERIFSWRNIVICCACFTCVQILIFHLILRIWGRKYGLERLASTELSTEIANIDAVPRKRKSGNVPVKFRRKSAEEKRERNVSESSSTALQRRPSTEALNITGTYTDLLIHDSASHLDYQVNSGNGEKSIHYNKGTSSVSAEGPEADISGCVRIEDLKELYDEPSDEYEFYGPQEGLIIDSCSKVNDCGSETTLDSSNDSVAAQPKKAKAMRNKNKSRRLSSPSFFKSPFSSGSSAAKQTGWEWHRSKKLQNSSQINNKKSKSVSPPSLKPNGVNSKNSTAPPTVDSKTADNQKFIPRNDSARASISLSIDDRKTSGSFKRILKKIF